jgi:phosphoribosyl 1,2-cyclic phosphodiesterase
MPVFVKFWGTRGSIPTPGPRTQRYGGNTSCVEIRTGEALAICDGGTGLRELGTDLAQRPNVPKTMHLFFSHPHWDHIQGFPFFGPAYAKSNTLHVYGTAKKGEHIHSLLSGQMRSSYFPVDFKDLGANIVASACGEEPIEIGDLSVLAFNQTHPGGSIGYRFEHADAHIAYATDHELDVTLLDAEMPERDPNALRKFPAPLIEAIQGVDLLIADAQYTDQEYPSKRGWGHPRATTVVDLAVQAGVRQLALYHHDPMHSDEEVEAILADCAERAKEHGSDLEVFAAREGVELKFG